MEKLRKSAVRLSRRDALRWTAAAGTGLAISQFPTFLRQANAQPVTLRHLVAINTDMAPAFKEVIATYEKAHPNVKISFDLVGWTDTVTKASQAAAGGQPYDVIDAGSGENQWTLQQQGLLEPITDVIEELGAGKYFAPSYLTKWKGEYWMAPYLVITLHIEYRKDLFDAKKLRAPLRTWDQWFEAAKALTDKKANKYGFIMPLKTSYFASTLHASMLLSNGGHILDSTGKVVFNSPQTIEMLRFTKQLANYCVPNQGEQDIGDLQTLFYKEVSGMTWYSEVDIVPNVKKLNPSLKGKIGIMPIPARTASEKPALRMIAQYFSVGKGSAHPQEARDYIKHLLQVDNQVKIIKSVPIANVPAIPAVKDSPQLWADPDIAANKQLYLDYIDLSQKYGREIAIRENPSVINPKTGEIMGQNILTQCVQDVVLKGVPPEKAAAQWAAKMESIAKS